MVQTQEPDMKNGPLVCVSSAAAQTTRRPPSPRHWERLPTGNQSFFLYRASQAHRPILISTPCSQQVPDKAQSCRTYRDAFLPRAPLFFFNGLRMQLPVLTSDPDSNCCPPSHKPFCPCPSRSCRVVLDSSTHAPKALACRHPIG